MASSETNLDTEQKLQPQGANPDNIYLSRAGLPNSIDTTNSVKFNSFGDANHGGSNVIHLPIQSGTPAPVQFGTVKTEWRNSNAVLQSENTSILGTNTVIQATKIDGEPLLTSNAHPIPEFYSGTINSNKILKTTSGANNFNVVLNNGGVTAIQWSQLVPTSMTAGVVYLVEGEEL